MTQLSKEQEEREIMKTVAGNVNDIFDGSGLKIKWTKCSIKGDRIFVEIRRIGGHPKLEWYRHKIEIG